MNGTSQARAWTMLLALAGGLLVFQVVERSQGWTARSRARQLGQELLAAETPEQAAAVSRELGALEDAAVEPLVQALVSEEPLVSAAAAAEISRRLAAWRQLPRKASGKKVAALVAELARERELIPPEQQRSAKRWAEAILLWPLKGSRADAAAVLADCEAILELPRPDEELVAHRLARLAEQKERAPEPASPVEIELPTDVVAPENDVTLSPIVSPADVFTPPMASISDAEEESPESPPIPLYPREPPGIYVPRARPIEDAAPRREPPMLPPGEPLPLRPVSAAADTDESSSLSEVEVMRDLHSEDPDVVTAAEEELTRRGYKAAHLTLARQLTNPDAANRLKLVQALPRARGIDPRPWLLRLSEDSDEGVREAARNILRTSQDPELLQKLR
jgi:hypothetical protein